MKVTIELQRTNTPIEIEADATYQKGDLFCVATGNFQTVYKYPLDTIFRVKEEYVSASRQSVVEQ